MDMEINTPRGRSDSSSANSSRESSTHSNASSIPYHERMQIQSNNLPWSEQVKINERENFSLLYATPGEGEDILFNKVTNNSPKEGAQCVNKEAPALNEMPISQCESEANNMTNTYPSQDFMNVLISYNINQPVELNAWDGEAHPISIFGTMEFLKINSMNMTSLLLYMANMANFIRNRSVKCNMVNDIKQLQGFGQAAWQFILSIYKAGWDVLGTNKNKRMFRQNILSKFFPKSNINKPIKRVEQLKNKQVEVVKLPPLILARLSKETLEKSKIFNKKDNMVKETAKPKTKQLYTQESAPNIGEILKLKENFPCLSAKKIKNIHRTINDFGKAKLKISMTTKGPSRKQIIIPMDIDNKSKFIASLNAHITNINSTLRNIKSDIIANLIWMD